MSLLELFCDVDNAKTGFASRRIRSAGCLIGLA